MANTTRYLKVIVVKETKGIEGEIITRDGKIAYKTDKSGTATLETENSSIYFSHKGKIVYDGYVSNCPQPFIIDITPKK